MGFEFGDSALLDVEIEGEHYTGTVDSPEVVAFWADNAEELRGLSALTADSPDADVSEGIKRFVTLTVEFTVALFGAEAAQAIFNGRARSLLFCVALMDYLNVEIEAQGLMERLDAASRKYAAAKVIG